MRERGRDNFLLPRESCFSSFFVRTPAVTNFCWSFCWRFFVRRFVVLRRSLVSATRLLFRVLLFRLLRPIFSFHQNNNEKRIYYSITISQRRERKREKEKGEKLFAAFPSHRRKTSSTKQKRDREIERITQNTEEENCVLYPIRREFLKRKDDPSVLFAVQI